MQLAKLSCQGKFAFDTETDHVEPTRPISWECRSLWTNTRLGACRFPKKGARRKSGGPFCVGFTKWENREDRTEHQVRHHRDAPLRCEGGRKDFFDTMLAHYLLNPELKHNMDYLAERYLNYKTVHIEELIGAKGKCKDDARRAHQSDLTNMLPKMPTSPGSSSASSHPNRRRRTWKNSSTRSRCRSSMCSPTWNQPASPSIRKRCRIRRADDRHDEPHRKGGSEMAGEDFNINSTRQVGEILYNKLNLGENIKKRPRRADWAPTRRRWRNCAANIPSWKRFRISHLQETCSAPTSTRCRNWSIPKQARSIPHTIKRWLPQDDSVPPIPTCRTFRCARNWDADPQGFHPRKRKLHLLLRRLFTDRASHHGPSPAATKTWSLPSAQVPTSTQRQPRRSITWASTRWQRRCAAKPKTANFGIIYGISVFGWRKTRNSARRSEGTIDGYFQTYHRIKEYMNESIERAKTNGYVETIFHRKRFLPDINCTMPWCAVMPNATPSMRRSKAVPPTSSNWRMNRIFARFEKEGLRSKMILQVHDELNFNVYQEELDEVKKICPRWHGERHSTASPADCRLRHWHKLARSALRW